MAFLAFHFRIQFKILLFAFKNFTQPGKWETLWDVHKLSHKDLSDQVNTTPRGAHVETETPREANFGFCGPQIME